MSGRVAPLPQAAQTGKSTSTPPQRRRETYKIHLAAADVWELQKTRDNTKTKAEYMAPYIPILSWAVWLLVGTLFYAYSDGFGIVFGFYQSVNIGWSVGWVTPIETSAYQSVGSNIFSIFHTSIGVMFIGIAVIYIAKKATESKDSWMMEVVRQDKLIDAANTEGIWDDIVAAFDTYHSKYKIIVIWILWLIVGLIFGCVWVEEWRASMALDFVLSTVSGGGYMSLPPGSAKWKYFFTAFYTAIGMPITSISIGLIISFAMISNNTDAYYDAICSVVTDKELQFMKIFGIDDGDGTIDNREFIILIAVRFGAASPGLLAQIKERFEELDRDRSGHIKYNDLIKGRRGKIVKNQFKKALESRAFKLATLLQSSESFECSESYWDKKREMYGLKPSLNEADEEVDSDEENSEGPFGNSKTAVSPDSFADLEMNKNSMSDRDMSTSVTDYNDLSANHESQCEGSLGVEGGDIESQAGVGRREVVDKLTSGVDPDPSETKENEVEEVVKSLPGGASHAAQPVMTGSDHCHSSEQISFYKVTKAAQLWKKKAIDEEGPVTNMPHPPEATAHTTAAAGSTVPSSSSQLDQMEPAKTSRRQTFVNQLSGPILFPIKKESRCSLSWLLAKLKSRIFVSIITWTLWLVVGTIFYAVHESRTLGEALYYSISVGYGVFWLTVEANPWSLAFTRIHFCLGMVAIGSMMAAFASILVDSKTKWYVEAMKVKALEDAGKTEGYADDITAFFIVHGPRLKIHVIFLTWVFIGTLWSCLTIEWPLIDGVYFSVSALSSGGLWAIPENSPAWYYAFVAFYVVAGVPIMAISLGMIANSVSNIGGSRLLEQKLSARITEEEIEMMESFGIVDDDGTLDAKEFAILTLVRIGALQPSLICMIHERFEEIDVNKTGKITYDDLMRHGSSKMKTVGKNLQNNRRHVTRKLGFN